MYTAPRYCFLIIISFCSYRYDWSNKIVTDCCIEHIGTRMWRRGANLEGDSANFIETEQLLEFEGFRYSLLQVLPPLGICLQIMIVPVDMFSTQYLEWISPVAMLFLGPCLKLKFWKLNIKGLSLSECNYCVILLFAL